MTEALSAFDAMLLGRKTYEIFAGYWPFAPADDPIAARLNEAPKYVASRSRTNHRVPHTITCLLLGVSLSWFYKWRGRPPTPRQQRRADLDAVVAAMFDDAKGLHGSPRLRADLRAAGWVVTEKTVAESMRRQGLAARKAKRRKGLTKQDKTAPRFPDLVNRDFTAVAPNRKWCGDVTEVPTADGKLYLATVIELYSRRLLAAATSLRCDAELCEQAQRWVEELDAA
jgi:hypothetical protein